MRLPRTYVQGTKRELSGAQFMGETSEDPRKTMIDDMWRQNWSTLHSLAIESDVRSEGIQAQGN